MLIISSTMLFNGGMIPMYMVVRSLGFCWIPVGPLWCPVCSACSISLSCARLCRVFPTRLEEAARLDGANDFTIMFPLLILPLCKSTFAVIMLFSAVAKWNDFMSALMYLPTRTDLYPLQMVLRDILMENSEITSSTAALQDSSSIYRQNTEYAAIVVSTLPILCIYPFLQKYFVTGMTIGAVKA